MAALNEAGIYEQDFTVSGAAIGDIVDLAYSSELNGCTLNGYVVADNTVRVQLVNNTGSTRTLDPGQLDIVIYKN